MYLKKNRCYLCRIICLRLIYRNLNSISFCIYLNFQDHSYFVLAPVREKDKHSFTKVWSVSWNIFERNLDVFIELSIILTSALLCVYPWWLELSIGLYRCWEHGSHVGHVASSHATGQSDEPTPPAATAAAFIREPSDTESDDAKYVPALGPLL